MENYLMIDWKQCKPVEGVSRFVMINGKSFEGSYLKCLEKLEGQLILNNLHSGVNVNRFGAWSLIQIAHLAGFFWPTVHQSVKPMHATMPLWPFMRWGMDILAGSYLRLWGKTNTLSW